MTRIINLNLFFTKLIVSLVLLACPIAFANSNEDTDGYFCFNYGYLAYQFNDVSFPLVAPAVTVTFLKNELTVRSVNVPPFQVQGMSCEEDKVVIQAANLLYTITWREDLTLNVAKSDVLPPGKRIVKNPLGNVGLQSWFHRPQPQIYIESDNPSFDYILQFIHQSRPRAAGDFSTFYHKVMTELLRVDHRGEIRERMPIFEGVFNEAAE